MSEAIPLLPHTPSWHGTQLKHRDNFTFTVQFSVHLNLGPPVVGSQIWESHKLASADATPGVAVRSC